MQSNLQRSHTSEPLEEKKRHIYPSDLSHPFIQLIVLLHHPHLFDTYCKLLLFDIDSSAFYDFCQCHHHHYRDSEQEENKLTPMKRIIRQSQSPREIDPGRAASQLDEFNGKKQFLWYLILTMLLMFFFLFFTIFAVCLLACPFSLSTFHFSN